MKHYHPIPERVLDQIERHRTHMVGMIQAYRNHIRTGRFRMAGQIGNALAQLYLQGATELSAIDTYNLSHHVLGVRSPHDYWGFGKD